MNARPVIAAPALRVASVGTLVLAAVLIVPGVTIGGEPDDQSIDPATQAAWLEQHFQCEHPAEMADGLMAAGPMIDPATQAAWLEQHFQCEHPAEMADGLMAAGPMIDPATQAAWLEQHFQCEHPAEMAVA